MWVERIPNAGIYRGEILGALGPWDNISLFSESSRRGNLSPFNPVLSRKESRGQHGSNLKSTQSKNTPLKMNQSQANVLRLMTCIVRDLPICIAYTHVHSHLDDHISYDLLPVDYQQNADMDALAQSALDDVIESCNFIASQFPYEPFTIHCAEKRIMKNFTASIYIEQGRTTAQEMFFCPKDSLLPINSKIEVYWDAIHHLFTKVYPPTFCVCGIRKQRSKRYLHRNEPQTYPSPACPCCGHPNEDASHIILCPDKGRTNLYNDSVTDLVRWMAAERENAPHNLALPERKTTLQTTHWGGISTRIPTNNGPDKTPLASWTATRRQIWTAEFEASLSSTKSSYNTETRTTPQSARTCLTESRRKTEEKEEKGKDEKSRQASGHIQTQRSGI
ncbi:hypothetical protein THAOC_29523 [Thalassiosira oceanica]|uniref:Uncharacterized protein n=1 Tax=Thalassiosira oceanica TaxID=159749 RepID=K0RDN2_THAOC|nr:hypothetical protein THAOC_29523 [Thalassiosira oceanica]|eukprot:EJK51315.1 hypothetical protein THAOC_29523 [Thalassiosira oceanica]